MAIADGKVSQEHLRVTMETLTNEEVLGLIKVEVGILKMAELISSWTNSISRNLFFEIQHERTSPSKWLRKN